jgi:hypothetical protein
MNQLRSRWDVACADCFRRRYARGNLPFGGRAPPVSSVIHQESERTLKPIPFIVACAALVFHSYGALACAAEPTPYYVKVTTADLTGNSLSANVIAAVAPASPGERAGLQVGDRILAYDGYRIYGSWDMTYLRQFKKRRVTSIELIVNRDGTLIAMPMKDLDENWRIGIVTTHDHATWLDLLDELKIAYEPEDIPFLVFQSPRTAIELKEWLNADPANRSRTEWVKAFFALRKKLAFQEWKQVRPIDEKIPLPHFRQLADFYVSVAKRNAQGEQPPDPSAHNVDRDFYVCAYPMPRLLLPPLGKYRSSDKTFDVWLQTFNRNYLQFEPPAEAFDVKDDGDRRDATPIEVYLNHVKMSIAAPRRHGGWPMRFQSEDFDALNPVSRQEMIRQLEELRAKHNSDEPLYCCALSQLYATHGDTKAVKACLESLWELSPLLAYRAASSNHANLLTARNLKRADYEAFEQWRLSHLGPLAPKETVLFKYVLDRDRSLTAAPSMLELTPPETDSIFYPGHLAIALHRKVPFKEEFEALDKSIDGTAFAQNRPQLFPQLVSAVGPHLLAKDLDRVRKLTRDNRGSGLAVDAMLEMLERSEYQDELQLPIGSVLQMMVDGLLSDRPGDINGGYLFVLRSLAEVNWKDKPSALKKVKTLYEEYGRLSGTVEIAKALRKQGWNKEAQEYEDRVRRIANLFFQRLDGPYLVTGAGYVSLAGRLSASPHLAKELDTVLRAHQEQAGAAYTSVAGLHHARVLLTMGNVDDAVAAIVQSYSLPKTGAVKPVYTFEYNVVASDDEYRDWLVAQLAADKNFTAAHRAKLSLSPAGKREKLIPLLRK